MNSCEAASARNVALMNCDERLSLCRQGMQALTQEVSTLVAELRQLSADNRALENRLFVISALFWVALSLICQHVLLIVCDYAIHFLNATGFTRCGSALSLLTMLIPSRSALLTVRLISKLVNGRSTGGYVDVINLGESVVTVRSDGCSGYQSQTQF